MLIQSLETFRQVEQKQDIYLIKVRINLVKCSKYTRSTAKRVGEFLDKCICVAQGYHTNAKSISLRYGAKHPSVLI